MPAELSKISTDNLTTRAYQKIKEAIMAGRFQPGERLPIRHLAEIMGTGITPVREALLRLVSNGVLEMKPAHPISIPVLNKKKYLENRSIRIANEGLAAAEAATKINSRQLKLLERINSEMRQASQEGLFEESIAKNYSFHIEVCKAADMPTLLEIIEILWLKIGPSLNILRARQQGNDSKPNLSYHQHILQALKAKDPEAARAGMEMDLIHGGESLLEYFDKQTVKT